VAQRNAENWVFGGYNYVTFREGQAKLLDPFPLGMSRYPASGIGGVVSMSDANGRLQFFGDSYRIYNRNGQELVPYLLGDFYFIGAQSNGVLALPKPGSPGLYYFFYMGRDNDVTRVNRKLSYLAIDMKLNNGLVAGLPGQSEFHNVLD